MAEATRRLLVRRLETGVLFGITRDHEGWNFYLGLWCVTYALVGRQP